MKLLWLAWLSFASYSQASSECDASLQECDAGTSGLSDFADFEDQEEEEPFENDVLLLQVDLQLQSTRAEAKDRKQEAPKLASRPAALQGAEAQPPSAGTVGRKAEEASLAQLSGQSHHQAAALRLSLALRSISLLGSPGIGWVAVEVTLGILGAFLVFKLCIASFAEASGAKDAEKLSGASNEEIKKKALGACYLVVFMDVFIYGAFAPVVPLLREKFSLTAPEIASFLAIFSLAQAMATPVLGFLSDKVGRRTVIACNLGRNVHICALQHGRALLDARRVLHALRHLRSDDGSCASNGGRCSHGRGATNLHELRPGIRCDGYGLRACSWWFCERHGLKQCTPRVRSALLLQLHLRLVLLVGHTQPQARRRFWRRDAGAGEASAFGP